MKLTALALAALLLVACTSSGEQPQRARVATWRPIQSWSGRDNAQLGTFPTGGGPLRFHWQADPRGTADMVRLKIRLHSADSGRILAEVADQQGGGDGSKEIIDDHQRFYMSVEGTGLDWTIRVEEAVTPST
jgi:outer membrane biogenesis lipoprotein LolB